MNSRYKRRKVIEIEMKSKDPKHTDASISRALGWSYPTTQKRLKNPGKLSVDDAEKLCEHLGLDIVKFIKPF